MTTDPKIGIALDEDEEALFAAIERDELPLVSVLTPTRKRVLEAMARATISGERSKISLRVPQGDLTRLKSKAMQEGVPYQTLINSLIHKYVSG